MVRYCPVWRTRTASGPASVVSARRETKVSQQYVRLEVAAGASRTSMYNSHGQPASFISVSGRRVSGAEISACGGGCRSGWALGTHHHHLSAVFSKPHPAGQLDVECEQVGPL